MRRIVELNAERVRLELTDARPCRDIINGGRSKQFLRVAARRIAEPNAERMRLELTDTRPYRDMFD